jgi:hypothetical protein
MRPWNQYSNHDQIVAEIETLLKIEPVLQITSRKIYWAAKQHPDLAPFLSSQNRRDGTTAIGRTLEIEGWIDISDSPAPSRQRIWERPSGCRVRV